MFDMFYKDMNVPRKTVQPGRLMNTGAIDT